MTEYNDPATDPGLDGRHVRAIHHRPPLELLESVRKNLLENDLPHWVDHNAISVDGRPAVTLINLHRRVGPRRVQELLDAA